MMRLVDGLKELVFMISFTFPFHSAYVQYNSEEETHHLTLHF